MNRLRKRIISAACAFSMIASAVSGTLASAFDEGSLADVFFAEEQAEETELCQQSFELYPNGEDAGQVITLEGEMPEGAEAEAIDVSEEHDGIAAYDITITDGGEEYQPDEEHSVYVEIADPAITEGAELELWHIRDDGSRERIEDVTITDGLLSFCATGFSVYEIVDNSDTDKAFFNALAQFGGNGFKVPYKGDKAGTNIYYFVEGNYPNVGEKGRTGLNTTNDSTRPSNEATLYFKRKPNTKNQFYIYTKDADDNEQYVKMFRNDSFVAGRSALEYGSESEKTLFTLEKKAKGVCIHTTIGGDEHYWVRNVKNSQFAAVGYYAENETAIYLQFDGLLPNDESPNYYDGKEYGIFHYTNGSTTGDALMADEPSHSLIQLIIKANGKNDIYYVDEGNQIDRWKFTYDADADAYVISADGKYLGAGADGLTFTDTASDKFIVEQGEGNKLRLKSKTSDLYVTFDAANGFTATDDAANAWLYALDKASLGEKDYITFSADRVSISDIADGEKVIVYTRVWNNDKLDYDVYAVDSDGSLYPCYASGGKILWLGDGTGSLEWTFTEYIDAVSKKPNYFYELYNSYSEKFIAPKRNASSVAENKIGINMQGRRAGEFYSTITAWDNSCMKYIGLRPNSDNTKLEWCYESAAATFYFARLEDLNLSDSLHTVPTIDNNEYGIRMKMVNFDVKQGKAYGNAKSSVVTQDYFGEKSTEKLTKGILSNNLGEDGYPTIIYSDAPRGKQGASIAELFATDDAINVNHLFLEREYDSSGYFVYDSCQNYATLREVDADGKRIGEYNTNDKGEIDFTVYRELGTADNGDRPTRKHGQFYPFDTIEAGKLIPEDGKNTQNLFNAMAGALDEDDPRKYERLYEIQTTEQKEADYYFGMEMEAEFVQTPSGLDAWGNPVVFDFTGDDDFWLYVDEELVLDLGGTHSALKGSVNFQTGEVTYDNNTSSSTHSDATMETKTLREIFEQNYRARTPGCTDDMVDAFLSQYFAKDEKGDFEDWFSDYSKHKMKVFYMERGAGASNLRMHFNLSAVTPGHVVISKGVKGDGADGLDMDFLEYPFQIFYNTGDGEGEKQLDNSDPLYGVKYQGTNENVPFVDLYRPPGKTTTYEKIFFINPTKDAEISFPDGTISYRIVECAVDEDIYQNVLINGETVSEKEEGEGNTEEDGTKPWKEKKGDLWSYSSALSTADQRPSIAFDNYVSDDVIRDLYITKKLIDDNGNPITDDPSTFSFRLSLGSGNVNADTIQLANMHTYYVLRPDGDNKIVCRYDEAEQCFKDIIIRKTTVNDVGEEIEEDVPLLYSHENIEQIKAKTLDKQVIDGDLEDLAWDDVAFTTSGFGAISGIPSGYSICVPGLPAGTAFKVTEDIKTGYGLDHYYRVMGVKKIGDIDLPVPSYDLLDEDSVNSGITISTYDPQVDVFNKKGYSLTANKKWSDLDITTAHENVYTAVYVGGELLEGSVRRIKSPSTSAYYFWSALKPYSDGRSRTSLNDYEVREVLPKGAPVYNEAGEIIDYEDAVLSVSADGVVTGFVTLLPLSSGDKVNLNSTRTSAATPEGEAADARYNYIVGYAEGEFDGSSRTDTISNNREGGIAVRLFKWNSTEPLAGGRFELYDGTTKLGSYTSDAEGMVTMMYSFDIGKRYKLVQTAAPRGFVGMEDKLYFEVNPDESVTLYRENGDLWETDDSKPLGWAEYHKGSGGTTAFVDVYNKSFNFILVKTDKENADEMLSGASFALYKQRPTSISGEVKSKFPLDGFENLVMENGRVVVCGGNSGRTIDPGPEGAVFFLEEKTSPFNYKTLDDDIMFYVSPLGIPSMRGDVDYGRLVQTDDSFIYTLNVPNEVEDKNLAFLTIEKQVKGAFGDKSKEFRFTVTIEGAPAGDGFKWAKNGVEQTALVPLTGTSFTMKSNEDVRIVLPPDKGIRVTVSENDEDRTGYVTTFKLGGADAVRAGELSFDFTGSTRLLVTNTRDGIVPSGIEGTTGRAVALVLLPLGAIGLVLYVKRKRKIA